MLIKKKLFFIARLGKWSALDSLQWTRNESMFPMETLIFSLDFIFKIIFIFNKKGNIDEKLFKNAERKDSIYFYLHLIIEFPRKFHIALLRISKKFIMLLNREKNTFKNKQMLTKMICMTLWWEVGFNRDSIQNNILVACLFSGWIERH